MRVSRALRARMARHSWRGWHPSLIERPRAHFAHLRAPPPAPTRLTSEAMSRETMSCARSRLDGRRSRRRQVRSTIVADRRLLNVGHTGGLEARAPACVCAAANTAVCCISKFVWFANVSLSRDAHGMHLRRGMIAVRRRPGHAHPAASPRAQLQRRKVSPLPADSPRHREGEEYGPSIGPFPLAATPPLFGVAPPRCTYLPPRF